jgi:predicted Zn-ribbon and HTH transcriptional regulator
MDSERPRLEVADVVRAYGAELRRRYRLAAATVKVMWHIVTCRTALLGGHLDVCDACGYERISYNSCRDRHCPKCQAIERARWVAERMARLLPVPCFHVVFTLPAELRPLALRNKRLVYNLLFAAASSTLLTLARDAKRLGAEIGITAVLHTWGQCLGLHPHLHCIVTGGGLALDGSCWKPCRQGFLLPLGVLSKLFRGRFLAGLQRARDAGDLVFAGSTARLADPMRWAALRDSLYRQGWNVYAKPPFGGPEQVLRYLGAYTHRVAISNHRLVALQDGQVTFSYKDYRDGSRRKLMSLDAVEFLRRFLLHVLPPRFVRIRHYGLWAARNVKTKLVLARRLLTGKPPTPLAPILPRPWWERFCQLTGVDVCACPHCKTGRLQRLRSIPALRAYVLPIPVARSP